MLREGAGLPMSARTAAAVVNVVVQHGLTVCRALLMGRQGPLNPSSC